MSSKHKDYFDKLPQSTEWSFRDIENENKKRASRLEKANDPLKLIDDLKYAFKTALKHSEKAFVFKELRNNEEDDARVSIQFAVGSILFDIFFNSRIGYRAHYRTHYKCGLRFNNQLIAAFRDVLDDHYQDSVPIRIMKFSTIENVPPEDSGNITIQKNWIIESLEPYVSKVWMCIHRYKHKDKNFTTIPLGIGGPKIVINNGVKWEAPFRDEEDAWLEIKGRFLGSPRWRQGKLLIKERAKGLQERGTA